MYYGLDLHLIAQCSWNTPVVPVMENTMSSEAAITLKWGVSVLHTGPWTQNLPTVNVQIVCIQMLFYCSLVLFSFYSLLLTVFQFSHEQVYAAQSCHVPLTLIQQYCSWPSNRKQEEILQQRNYLWNYPPESRRSDVR